jgi:hypothetical protein
MTLLSLPPAPLLELVVGAARRQLTAVWLALASMLVAQLDPPALILTPVRSGPSAQSEATVISVLPALLDAALGVLGQAGAMEAASAQSY